jgi:hypothetical protein
MNKMHNLSYECLKEVYLTRSNTTEIWNYLTRNRMAEAANRSITPVECKKNAFELVRSDTRPLQGRPIVTMPNLEYIWAMHSLKLTNLYWQWCCGWMNETDASSCANKRITNE